MEDQEAIINSKEQILELCKNGTSIYSAKIWRQKLRATANPRVATVSEMTTIMEEVPVYKASIEDISKALRSKPSIKLQDARQSLPTQVKMFAHLFADDA